MYARLLVLMIGIGLLIGLVVPQDKSPDGVPRADVAQTEQLPPPPPQATKRHTIDTVIPRSDDGHFYVHALVNGQLVRFVVDTGASVIALTKADATRAGIAFMPQQFEVVARGASGDVMGQRVLVREIAVDQKRAYIQRAVVVDDGLDISLLGQNFLSQVGTVTITGDRMTLR